MSAMSRTFIILLFVFCVGCAKQPPKPIYIDIKPNGILQIGTGIYDNVSLKGLLRNRIRNEGVNIPIYLIAGVDTSFSKLKSVILTVQDAGGYELHFQVKGTGKNERCDHDFVIFDGGKVTKLNAEIKNNELYVDGMETTIEGFKVLISRKPVDSCGYRVLIACSDDSKFGFVYDIIETSNHSGTGHAEIAIMDEIMNRINSK